MRFAPFPAGDDFFAKGESAGPGGPLREVEPGRPDDGSARVLTCIAIWQNGRAMKQTGGLIDTSTAFGIYL